MATQHKSLCMVTYDYSGQKWLKRLADVNGSNHMKVPTFYDYLPKVFDNRDKLFGKDGDGPDETGAFAIWEWSAVPRDTDPEKDYVLSAFCEDDIPIEFIALKDIDDYEHLMRKLVEGISYSICCGKIAISYRNTDGNYDAIVVSRNQLDIDESHIKLSNDVVSLPLFEVFPENILRLNTKRVLNMFFLGAPKKRIVVKAPFEIVKDAIIKRYSWSAMKAKGLSRNEWKQTREFIEGFSEGSLYSDIAKELECTEEEAESYVQGFLSECDGKISGSEIDDNVLRSLINKIPELQEKCNQIVEETWISNHAKEVKEKKEVIDSLVKDIEKKLEEKNSLNIEIESLESKLNGTMESLGQQERLADEVKVRIAEKISEARTDAAEFISSMIMSDNNAFDLIGSDSESYFNNTYTSGIILEECNSSENWIEALENVADELLEAGVDSKRIDSLAALLYAAYINHSPLLIAGANGISIANAFSAGMFGRYADILDCSKNPDTISVNQIDISPGQIVIVKNLFNSPQYNNIVELLRETKKFIIVVNSFIEDLIIEPKSLFSYLLPVFTDVFVNKTAEENFVGAIRSDHYDEFTHSEILPAQENVLSELNLNMLEKNRIQSVLTDFHKMNGNITELDDLLYVIYPYAYLNDAGNIVASKIESETQLSKDMRSYLLKRLNINI